MYEHTVYLHLDFHQHHLLHSLELFKLTVDD